MDKFIELKKRRCAGGAVKINGGDAKNAAVGSYIM
jgi:hypothetical protein